LDFQHCLCEFVDLTATGEGGTASIAVDGGRTYDGGLDCTRGVCTGVDDDLIDVLVEGFLRETDEFVYTIQVIKDFVAVFAELVC
jgi:hypothetical protein